MFPKNLLLILPLLLSSLAFAAEKKTSEQYWDETGLSTEVLVKEIKLFEDFNCYPKLEGFRGCVAALNALGSFGEPAIRVVPTGIAPEVGEVLANFVGLSVVKVVEVKVKENETLRTVFMRQDAIRKKTDAALADLFKMAGFRKSNFNEIFEVVAKNAIKDRAKDAAAAGAAISSFMTETLDAHARLAVKAEVEDSMNDADQSFFGIGATIQNVQGKIVVAGTVEGSPSSKKGGLLANDIIRAVNVHAVPGEDTPVEGMTIEQVVKLIRGPEGTPLTLQVVRKGQEITIPLARGRVVIENVEASMVSDFGQKVGVIKLRSFMDRNACTVIKNKIAQLTAQGATGLVMDVRQNGGGLLDQAQCIGGIFMGRKLIVKVKDLKSDTFQDMFSNQNQVTDLPMVTLIDAGSASASEVLSGALRDHQRSWILGERSFGKATVQAPSPFLNEQFMLYRTIQRFYQPNGTTNQMVGISPDIEVWMKPDSTPDERFFLREAEIFPSGLEAVGPKWVQTRPEAVNALVNCVKSKNLAKNKYAEQKAKEQTADYQLYAAEEVLACQVK